MHTSALLVILPAVLASASNPLLAARQVECAPSETVCGSRCIPEGYDCCDGANGGCDPTFECSEDPSGNPACCIIPGQCSSDLDFTPIFFFEPLDGDSTSDTSGDEGTTITDSASLAEFTEAHQGDDSSDAPATTTGASDDDDAEPTESSNNAPAMTDAAGLVMALGAGVAMLL